MTEWGVLGRLGFSPCTLRGAAWVAARGLDKAREATAHARTRRLASELAALRGAFPDAIAAPVKEAADSIEGGLRRQIRPTIGLRNAPEFDRHVILNDHFDRTIQLANSIMSGQLRIYGTSVDPLHLSVDWHRDPLTGYTWPAEAPSSDIAICPGDGAEVRRAWEVGRCQFVVTLAQAAALTRELEYVRAFEAYVESFLKSNPFGSGIHWTCPMEAALRACSWVMGIRILYRAGLSCAPGFLRRLLGEVFVTALFIKWNREWWGGATNNHYLCDLLGLCAAGSLFPKDGQVAGMLAWSRSELTREACKQFAEDGFNREYSVPYHRFATEVIFYAAEFLRDTSSGIPARLTEVCRRSVRNTLSLLRADGTLPMVGDNDDSFVFRFEARPSNQFGHFPALAWLLDGSEYRNDFECSGEPEVFWLRGSKALSSFRNRTSVPHREPPQASVPDFGLFVASSGKWRFDIVCRSRSSGHSHSDLLALSVSHDRIPLFLDPGNAVYTSDLLKRNLYRGVAFHSTVRINDVDYGSVPCRGPRGRVAFGRPKSYPCHARMEIGPNGPLFEGESTAYRRAGVEVKRKVWVDVNSDKLVIEDEVELSSSQGRAATEPTAVEWSFHIGGNRLLALGDRTAIVRCGHHSLALESVGGGVFSHREASFSPAFGEERPATIIDYRWVGRLPKKARFEVNCRE